MGVKTITQLVKESNVSTIRGILIDPTNKTIEEVQLHEEMMMQHMYEYIHCDIIERIVSADHGLQINLDEEGLFKAEKAYFSFLPTMSVYPDPFVGRAIVTGYDFTSLPEEITLDYIKANTQFLA